MTRLETAHEFKKGVVAGLIAATVMFFFIEIFSWLDIIKFGQSYLGGETVFNYKNEIPLKNIAFFMSLSIGMFWGVILAFLFSKTFTDELYILKGMGFAFIIFVFHIGILDENFRKGTKQTQPSSIYGRTNSLEFCGNLNLAFRADRINRRMSEGITAGMVGAHR